jgi:hypothetical protein
VPINLQDYVLHPSFGSLQKEPNVLEDGRLYYGALPIGRLLTPISLIKAQVNLRGFHCQLYGNNFITCIGSWGL